MCGLIIMYREVRHLAKKLGYNHTIYCCFISYIVQSVVCNFAPLLFLTFMNDYSISIERISLLITANFVMQLLIDLVSPLIIKFIGYRGGALAALFMSALGLCGLAYLPDIMSDPFVGLLISVMTYAVGGGLIEVVISPMVEACPTDNKQSAMGLLHSFYCWGTVGVVLISTCFFALFGVEHRRIITLIWAVLPIINAVFFMFVPINTLEDEKGGGIKIRSLIKTKIFWVMVFLMVCSGATEVAILQWASTFAEAGLHVSKSVGDLAGPMLFAVLMGTARVFYSKLGDRIRLEAYMPVCGLMCIAGYLLMAFSPMALLGFVGCGLCGFAVGVMWPGTYSLSMKYIPNGDLSVFAFLALAGDVGCTVGPVMIGFATELLNGSLNNGIAVATLFPLLLTAMLFALRRMKLSAE